MKKWTFKYLPHNYFLPLKYCPREQIYKYQIIYCEMPYPKFTEVLINQLRKKYQVQNSH